MKALKIVLVVVGVIIAIPFIVALFLPNEYAVEREITIDKPKQEVFDYIKKVKNSENYSKWVMQDPNMKKEFKGTDGTVGFVYAWESQDDNVGKGEQEIAKIAEGEEIDFKLRFIKPFEGLADAYMSTTSVAETQTKVKWGFKSKTSYPMNIMCLFVDNMLGKDLEIGLANLKGVLEK